MPQIGVDEKAFRRRHSYMTVVNDIERGTVEYVTEDRETQSAPGASRNQVDTDGLLVQLGYLFPNQKLEVAGRYGLVSPDTAADRDQEETGVAFSWYISKHDYKLQADFRQVEDLAQSATSANREFDEARLQLQIAF